MKIYLSIYLLINYTIACFNLGSEWRFSDGSERIYECLRFVWISLFGIPVYLVYFLYEFIKESFIFLQVKFFYLYFFTKKFNKLQGDQLKQQENAMLNIFTSKSIRHRIYRYCGNLVRKRNGLKLITESKNKE